MKQYKGYVEPDPMDEITRHMIDELTAKINKLILDDLKLYDKLSIKI